MALKYVVHFVADVHQPLHAGYAEDRGGNTYQVQAFGRGTNLHALWDTGLIQNLSMISEALAAKLAAGKVGDANLVMARAAPLAQTTSNRLLICVIPYRRSKQDKTELSPS